MAKNNYTPIRDPSSSLMNGSWSGYTEEPGNDLEVNAKAFREFVETFPLVITNTIFNVIYAFGILANIVLVVYLIYYKRYKMPVFCVILSLGVADLGTCVGALLFNSLLFPLVLGPLWLCNVILAVLFLSYLVSNYHIAVFAVLRFVQLVYPLTSHTKVTTGLLFKICLTVWLANLLQALVIALYYTAADTSAPGSSAVYSCSFAGDRHILYFWIVLVWFLLPFIVTSGFHVAKQMLFALSHSAPVTSQDERVQRVRRQTDSRALAIVIVTYLVTIFPYIVQAIRVFLLNMSYNPVEVFIENVFFQIGYINSGINPWIYLFAAESVRSDVKKMIMCKR